MTDLPQTILFWLVILWIAVVAAMVVHPLVWPALLAIVALERGSYWFWLADQPECRSSHVMKGEGK